MICKFCSGTYTKSGAKLRKATKEGYCSENCESRWYLTEHQIEEKKMMDKINWDRLKEGERYGMMAALFKKVEELENRILLQENNFKLHTAIKEFCPHSGQPTKM